MADVKKTALFPLARLGPLGILTLLAGVSATYVLNTDGITRTWIALGLLPLITYLAYCQFQARKLLLADVGREREIVQMGFVVMAADRAARFWNVVFSAVAISTGIAVAGIWAYQGFLWFSESHWVPLTWRSVIDVMPQSDQPYLQQLYYWLTDTNFGVIVLISGLLICAPLAAVSWRSNNKARFRRNELSNLKKRS